MMLLMLAQENGVVLDEEKPLFLAGEQTNTFNTDVDEQPAKDLAQNEDNIFQADECDAFDSDIDDEPTAQSIFMANLSSASPVSFQAGPFHASILSEKPDLENNIDHVGEIHDEHEILNEVQQTSVVDSDSVDMGNSNIIPYEQYVMNNKGSVVPNNVSSVKIDDSLAAELAIYKEQAKKAQPVLYDGDKLLKMHHEHVIFPTSEEELELVDASKMKIVEKLKNDPEDVFYTVINSTLTAYRFHDLSAAYNVLKTRAVKLEAENFKLNEKIQQDDHDTMENGVYILLSIDEGPVQLGTTRETIRKTEKGGVILGPDRPRTYDDLSENDKKRFDVDVHATNIVLQGLPKDIYKLINHNIEAKAIWDNIKVLLAGFKLTKED
nr:integrase, catalytic region, zinc finger, CCHC-type, peptidase aspartic, catalytic [Tanacetum cinerariifolium]